ncbi:Importin-beta protein [Ancylostoma caninum]|uniref:Importin-beta protein n=1 Tax=Ancylostoma caninum TaxID=29170 RepID=A0A368FKQ3_ANCCA|nr:Importin-beta protein [Ancylostoma caninum]
MEEDYPVVLDEPVKPDQLATCSEGIPRSRRDCLDFHAVSFLRDPLSKMAQLLLDVLQKTISQNQEDQKRALEFLNEASTRDFPAFVKELSVILRSEECQPFARQAAGLQLKNVLYAKEEERRAQYLNRWLALPADIRAQVKILVVQTLGTEPFRPSIAAQCVAAIACAELPSGVGFPLFCFSFLHSIVHIEF